MFSLQPSDELVFGTPSAFIGYEIHEEDLRMDHALPETNLINFCTESSNKRVMSRTTNSELTHEKESNSSISISRRVLHRDIERKRRKEMSDLHLALASLLPTEPVKGKRAVCDQMQEAANYIKKLQNNIEELKIRRDRLAKLSENNYKVVSDDECVTIHPLSDGMVILIKSLHFGASPALEELAALREVDVVNYVSTRTNAGFLHKIHIQAKDIKSLDVSVLQHKLSNLAMK